MKATTSSDYNGMSSTGSASFAERSTAVNPGIMISSGLSENEAGKYSIFDVANWFLAKESMTHKKLQKLCYYAQAWCYALKNYKLANTTFEAWAHGPVSPALYNCFKDFGYDRIKMRGNFIPPFEKPDLDLLESVWTTYGGHTGNALEALSHSERPWKDARQGYAPNEKCSIPISPEAMKSYYLSIYNR